MSVPFTRTLPYVLREALRGGGDQVRALVAEVVAVPDDLHVTIDQAGVETTIARLASYTPAVGDPAYCLAAGSLVIAIGTVSATGGLGEGLFQARGDLVVGAGENEAVRKPRGGDDTVLVSDGGQADGLKWVKVDDAMILTGSRLSILAASGGTPSSSTYLRGDGQWASPI